MHSYEFKYCFRYIKKVELFCKTSLANAGKTQNDVEAKPEYLPNKYL